MYRDKAKAIKGAWRIQERTLFIVALCGGAIGIFIGSQLFLNIANSLSHLCGVWSHLLH